jgi:ParB family chromosome partitioning protein
MFEREIEVRMLKIDEIRPNPFQPRESFPKEDIQQLAESIKTFGLLQPILVRRKGKTYEIIAGERRWRAAHFAGLKEIPAIVKDATDTELMMQSLIENVHRRDLEPIEKARGLAEVYRLAIGPGFEPGKLKWIEDKSTGRTKVPLTEEEKRIKEVADMIGLSYDYQYRLLTLLRFTPEEQRRVSELKLGYEEASSIATIEQPEVRKKVIELAPELRREEVKKLSKIVKKAPEPVVKAVLERKITPDVAEVIAEVKEPEVMEKALEKATKGVYTVEGIKTIVTRLEKSPIELPEEPIEVQIHNKTLWNLKRIGDYDFYTIGFAKRTIDQFLELLRLKNVRTLVDVRKNPKSIFRPEFNRENLEKVLTAQGITYIHYPELGVPEEIREKLAETGDYSWFFNWYDNNILPNLDEVDLETLAYPIALMCVEFDPTRCHRHRIALALEERGLKGCDL